MNIILVGFKGAGKSTIGPLLAERLGYAFDDLDRRIEAAGGEILGERVTFREVFRRLGEEAFRALEQCLLGEALGEENLVLALGGGAALHGAAPDQLSGHLVVYIRVAAEALFRRIEAEGWPAYLDGEADPAQALRKILEERLPRYEALADIVVDNPDGADPAAAAKHAADRILGRRARGG
ncbi:MAG: AAA family ATPase [bacterium]|nr:AAA family ATPase [bacterium]